MPEEIALYRVFISSPGGLNEEREAFRDVINNYNETEAIHRGVQFFPMGWESTLGGMGRPQSYINEDVRESDYFVLLLWDRWGTPPGSAENGNEYTSGTEEEYHVAKECFGDSEARMRQIVAFFKAVEERHLSDPGEELRKVLNFKRGLEEKRELYYTNFDELESFKDRLRAHLAQWLRDHEEGNNAKVTPPVTPDAGPEGVEATRLSGIAPEQYAEADIEKSQDEALQRADKLADEGKLVDSEVAYAKAVSRGTDPDAFNRYGLFLMRIGQLTRAQVMFERILEMPVKKEKWVAIAYGNLGLIYQTRGDLEKAEQMQRKSLEISERLGRQKDMASAYGNLGNIYQTRGDLEKAEQMHHKSLEICERLGWQKGMACQYGNLGLIYNTRGNLEKAEQMHRKGLEIEQSLGRQEGMAIEYGNLGLIYKKRGKLEKAEEMVRESLEINEHLGLQESMASDYGNLGVIYQTRRDLEKAEEMYHKSLEINERLGRQKGMAIQYGNLGLIYQKQGGLEKAEQMYHKALEISKRLGLQEGMANQCVNLGSIAKQQGDQAKAREFLTKARDIFRKIGIPHKVEKVQGLLDGLDGEDEG